VAPDRAAAIARAMLAWYDRHARSLPWRSRGPVPADPYRVWLSEIMLQQTTVAAVGPYFRRFLDRWPEVADLAAAPLDAVLAAWAGLGYYARARNLHRCAQEVVARHDGRFPDTEAALRALPGIGDYTAAAVAAIAFGRRAAVLDGNVERVAARLFAVAAPLPQAKARLRALVGALTPEDRPGDFAQAMMDLGATICIPREPRCILCPIRPECAAVAAGEAERYPVKPRPRRRPLRHGVAFWLTRPDGTVWLRRRADRGLLGGMMEVPSTDWTEAAPAAAETRRAAPLSLRWTRVPGTVRHVFTHFELELEVWVGQTGLEAPEGGTWVRIDHLKEAGLPTLMHKVAAHAVAAAPPRLGRRGAAAAAAAGRV